MEEQDYNKIDTLYYLKFVNNKMMFHALRVRFAEMDNYSAIPRPMFITIEDDDTYGIGYTLVEGNTINHDKNVLRKIQRQIRIQDINRAMQNIEANVKILQDIGAWPNEILG